MLRILLAALLLTMGTATAADGLAGPFSETEPRSGSESPDGFRDDGLG